MYSYKKWFDNTSEFKSLGPCLIYKQTKLDKLLANILPYIIPFINKRQRVTIRNYWKYRYARRACTRLCKLLKNQKYNKPFPIQSFNNTVYEWEIINKREQ